MLIREENKRMIRERALPHEGWSQQQENRRPQAPGPDSWVHCPSFRPSTKGSSKGKQKGGAVRAVNEPEPEDRDGADDPDADDDYIPLEAVDLLHQLWGTVPCAARLLRASERLAIDGSAAVP